MFAACATPPPPEPDPEPAPEPLKLGQPVAVAAQFPPSDSGIGCVATQDTTQLRGVIVVKPFGKGTDGAVLDDGEIEWAVSYDAEDDAVFESFDGVEVIARGRPCDKEGAAVELPHFELMSLRAIEE